MDQLLDVFFQIDIDRNESISSEELIDFVNQNGLDEEMIETWLRLFDPKHTGRITLKSFCDTLGLTIEDIRSQQSDFMRFATSTKANVLGDDVEVIIGQMPFKMQMELVNQARSLLIPDPVSGKISTLDATRAIKENFEKSYGPMWHVLIIRGSHWMSYGHETERTMQFRYNKHTIIAWRTPQLD